MCIFVARPSARREITAGRAHTMRGYSGFMLCIAQACLAVGLNNLSAGN